MGRAGLRDVPEDVSDLSARCDEGVAAARDYIVGATGPDGRLAYRVHLDREIKSGKYNVLRHAGTLYALGMLPQRGLSTPAAGTALLRAADYLEERYVQPLAGHDNLSTVFSLPDEEQSPTGQPQAKLGGAGLAILGLLAARQQDPASVDLDALRRLGDFILFMMEPDGSFHSKWTAREGYDTRFNSLYYPGEAILALTRLYAADPDPKWLNAAGKAAGRIVISRRGVSDLPADHWLLIATGELLPLYGKVEQPLVPADELYAHVVTLGDMFIASQQKHRDARLAEVHGAFDGAGQCTPASTRLEGLVALYDLAKTRGDTAVQQRIAPALQSGGEFILRCQVESGPHAGGIVRTARAVGDDDRRQREIRVDYVQHFASACLGISRICEGDGCTD